MTVPRIIAPGEPPKAEGRILSTISLKRARSIDADEKLKAQVKTERGSSGTST